MFKIEMTVINTAIKSLQSACGQMQDKEQGARLTCLLAEHQTSIRLLTEMIGDAPDPAPPKKKRRRGPNKPKDTPPAEPEDPPANEPQLGLGDIDPNSEGN